MSTLSLTTWGDYDPAHSQTYDLSSYIPASDRASIFFAQVGNTPDTLSFSDDTTGKYYNFHDGYGNGAYTEHNRGFKADFSDNTAGCNLLGGDFADILIGGRAADELSGGLGEDVLDGKAGADVIEVDGLASKVAAYILAPDGADLVDLSGAAQTFGVGSFTRVSHFDGQDIEVKAIYDADADRTVLKFDTDRDGRADHKIIVVGADYSDFSHVAGVAAAGGAAPDHDGAGDFHGLVV